MVGQTIANYRITSLLARERSRAIYAAEDVRQDRALAIQVWQRDLPEDPRAAPHLDSEARAALGHPNIAQVLEEGISEEAQPYRVMELLDGETLAARLRVQACVRVPEAVAIAREVAGALAAAHEAGIVHGQLTTASLFITLDPSAGRGERVKLLDFGAGSGPEGQQLAARADCRALGEILFEMLCGAPPFLVECAEEGSNADRAPPSPRSINPDIPQPLEDLIVAALAPGEGSGHPFASMADLRRALDSLALGPATVPAPTPSGAPEPEEAAMARPSLGTSAFDVPPMALPPAPATPLAAASPMSRLLAWLGELVAPGRRARMAASMALVALVVVLSILAGRTGAPRRAGRTPLPAAARFPASAEPAMTPIPPAATEALGPWSDSPAPPPAPDQSASPPAPAAPERACIISIGSQPWSEVWIDGKSTGRHTPLMGYRVPCGRHTLTLKNAELAVAKSTVVTLNPRSRLKRIFRFAEPETTPRGARRGE